MRKLSTLVPFGHRRRSRRCSLESFQNCNSKLFCLNITKIRCSLEAFQNSNFQGCNSKQFCLSITKIRLSILFLFLCRGEESVPQSPFRIAFINCFLSLYQQNKVFPRVLFRNGVSDFVCLFHFGFNVLPKTLTWKASFIPHYIPCSYQSYAYSVCIEQTYVHIPKCPHMYSIPTSDQTRLIYKSIPAAYPMKC